MYKPRIIKRSLPQRSKTIQSWCDKNSDLVDEYICDSDGHWVYFKDGWVHQEMECGTVHELTVKEVMERLTRSQIVYWGS